MMLLWLMLLLKMLSPFSTKHFSFSMNIFALLVLFLTKGRVEQRNFLAQNGTLRPFQTALRTHRSIKYLSQSFCVPQVERDGYTMRRMRMGGWEGQERRTVMGCGHHLAVPTFSAFALALLSNILFLSRLMSDSVPLMTISSPGM